jgi:hypothetical protein
MCCDERVTTRVQSHQQCRRPPPESRFRGIPPSSIRFVSTCEPSFDPPPERFDPRRFFGSSTRSYEKPPLGDVTIEEFELFAIDRLRVLGEIESSWARNRSADELKEVVKTQCSKCLTLDCNSAKTVDVDEQRRKDHIGHFILRLAFCRS